MKTNIVIALLLLIGFYYLFDILLFITGFADFGSAALQTLAIVLALVATVVISLRTELPKVAPGAFLKLLGAFILAYFIVYGITVFFVWPSGVPSWYGLQATHLSGIVGGVIAAVVLWGGANNIGPKLWKL